MGIKNLDRDQTSLAPTSIRQVHIEKSNESRSESIQIVTREELIDQITVMTKESIPKMVSSSPINLRQILPI